MGFYVINPDVFRIKLKNNGFSSLTHLANALKVNRNTIHYYLSGGPVFPKQLARIISALQINPATDIISTGPSQKETLEDVAPLIDQLQKEFPTVTFVLFGSRARGHAHLYSDFDIGIYSSQGMPHVLFRSVKRVVIDFQEYHPCFFDVVNLNAAEPEFLAAISPDWIFLGGRFKDWLKLQSLAKGA